MEQDKTHNLQAKLNETLLRKCPQCNTVFSAIAYCPNDGTKLEEHDGMGSLHGLFADKYEILEEIGKGGMGTVYRVRQVLLDKILALKVIPSHYLNEHLAVRFQREAKTMAALNHVNLVRIYDFGIWLNQPFMVMEYISGSPLSKLIAERVISPAQAIDLFAQVLDGLEHAHAQGVLHRDIKPSNIMVVNQDGINKAILLDFGIAKKIETDNAMIGTQALTRTGEMIGSPLYMSPEQARGEKVTERCDLYSLGCALFESLTGTPPFVGKTAVETFFLHIEQTPPSLKEAALGREFSPALEKVLRRMLAKNPEDRYSSAKELKEALLSCLEEKKTEDNVPVPTNKQTSVMPIATVALITILVLAGTLVSIGKDGKETPRVQPQPQPQAQPQSAAKNSSSLSFYKTTLNDEQVNQIVREKNLSTLNLEECIIPKGLIARLPTSLERLELDGCGILNPDLESIAALANLRTLSLNFNQTNRGVHYLESLKKLELLDLTSVHCDLDTVKQLGAMKNLKYLFLTDNVSVDDRCMDVIAGLPNLEWLDISDTSVTDRGIAKLAKLPNLTRLGAKRLMINNEKASVFKSFTKLKTLNLSGNPISIVGLKQIALTGNLTELDLSGCFLNDDTIPYLLSFKNLKDLDVSIKQVSPRAIMKLARLPLRTLHAKELHTNMTVQQAQEFLNRCPSCQVVYFGDNGHDTYMRNKNYKKDKEEEHEYQMP